jgi:acyl-CoA thioesterase I
MRISVQRRQFGIRILSPRWIGLLAALAWVSFAPDAAHAAPGTILVLGDSLSAEYGLPRDSGWVKLLADRIAQRAPQYSVVNSSISGDTSSGGRARLGALLARHHPSFVLVELGANDGLRGLPVEPMRANLKAIIQGSRAAGARVLLIGIRVPPNYGPEYAGRFDAAYGELARSEHVDFVPFLLEGFADRLDWFQADHLHPLAAAQPSILENVWARLAPLLGAPQ